MGPIHIHLCSYNGLWGIQTHRALPPGSTPAIPSFFRSTVLVDLKNGKSKTSAGTLQVPTSGYMVNQRWLSLPEVLMK